MMANHCSCTLNIVHLFLTSPPPTPTVFRGAYLSWKSARHFLPHPTDSHCVWRLSFLYSGKKAAWQSDRQTDRQEEEVGCSKIRSFPGINSPSTVRTSFGFICELDSKQITCGGDSCAMGTSGNRIFNATAQAILIMFGFLLN